MQLFKLWPLCDVSRPPPGLPGSPNAFCHNMGKRVQIIRKLYTFPESQHDKRDFASYQETY